MSFRSWENSLRGDNGVRYIKGFVPRKLKENLISETMTVYRLGEIPNDEESFFVTPDYKTWIKFYPGEEIHKITTNKLYLPLRSKSFSSWDELRSKYNSGEFTDDDVSYINPEESGIQDFEQYEIKPDDIIDLEQINLEEGRKNKPDPREVDKVIMAEGRYDSLTRSIVQDIMYAWKADYEGKPDKLEYEEDYNIEDSKGSPFVFNLVAKLKVALTKRGTYRVNGGINNDYKIPYFEIDFQVDPRELPKMWSAIYMDLIDVVRHELEHLTQRGTNVKGVVTIDDPRAKNDPKLVRPGKQMDDDQLLRYLIKIKDLPKADYFRLEQEVDAMLQGMYLKAKKIKTFEAQVKHPLWFIL